MLFTIAVQQLSWFDLKHAGDVMMTTIKLNEDNALSNHTCLADILKNFIYPWLERSAKIVVMTNAHEARVTGWSNPQPSPRVVVQAGARVPAATPAAQSGDKWIEVPTEFDAIMLSSYGGPNGQDDVLPFLRNVTMGRNIPDERLEEVA